MAYFNIKIGWTISFIPIILIIQLLFTLGLSLVLSIGNLYFRDVGYVTSVAVQLWMYLTAVVYPLNVPNKVFVIVLKLNPMTPIIESYRDVILRQKLPLNIEFSIVAFISVIIFLSGWYIFHRAEHLFAENI